MGIFLKMSSRVRQDLTDDTMVQSNRDLDNMSRAAQQSTI